MNVWSGLGTALIAALVSILVTLALRALDARKVMWVITGEGHDEYASGRPTGRVRANLRVHNVGDGDAFGVLTTRCNGGAYESFEEFEAGRIPGGGSFDFSMSVDPKAWDSAWFEIQWAASPTSRSKPNRSDRHHLGQTLYRRDGAMGGTGTVEYRYRPPR